MIATMERKQKTEAFPATSPHSRAEMSVLGAMMIEVKAVEIAIQLLLPEDFADNRNQFLFKELERIYQLRGPLDEVIVDAELIPRIKNARQQQEIRDYLGRCIMECGTAANVESYCQIVKAESNNRALKEAGQLLGKAAAEKLDPFSIADQINERLALIGATTNPDVSSEDVWASLQSQCEWFGWPGFPALSSLLMFLPGSMTVICGSPGASKSFWLCELMWRLAFNNISCSILQMEKGARFHLERICAQICERAMLTDPRWRETHRHEVSELKVKYGEAMQRVTRERIVQAPGNQRADCGFLLRWLQQQIRDGRQVIAIDSLSIMAGGEARYMDQERFMEGAEKLVTRSGVRLIFVLHPKENTNSRRFHPSLSMMKGSKSMQERPDTILWLGAHSDNETGFSPLDDSGRAIKESEEMRKLRDPKSYNRTVTVLKARLAAGQGRKVGVQFDNGSLHHIERGWL